MHLYQIFKCKKPHEIAALHMLEEQLDPELLDRNADWIVCFFSEPPDKEPLIMEEKL